MKELGEEAGKKFGLDLIQNPVYSRVDVIIPVPLHPKKFKKRGYNQSEWIARGIGSALAKPVSTENLCRLKFTATQTRKTKYERWKNVEGIFGLNQPQVLENKHILLVDDVITTGATLEACSAALEHVPGIEISVATLAYADY